MAYNINELTKEIATALARGETMTAAGILPNPDEVLRKRGEAKTTYDKVLNDPRVVATMGSRKAGVKKLLWEVKHESNKAAQKFTEGWLKGLNMQYIISKILDAPQYGMQPLEVMWGRDGGRIIPVDIIDKPFDWFGFNVDRELRFKTKGSREGAAVPDKKILLPRYEYSYDNPYGKPLLSLCFWSVAMKRGALPIYLNYIEKYGSAHFVGKLPPNATDEDHNKMLDALESLIDDAVTTVSDNTKVEILETSSKGITSGLFNDFLAYADQDITLVQLGQTLTTSTTGEGSFALGKVHGEVRSDIIDGDAAIVENTFNELISWAHEINFGNADAPKFLMYAEEDIDMQLAERDAKLAATGQIRFSKKYWTNAYGLQDDDFELTEGAGSPYIPPQNGLHYGEVNTSSFNQINFTETDGEDLNAVAEEFTAPLLDAVKGCKSFDELQAKLGVIYNETDKDGKLEDNLAVKLFKSLLNGFNKAFKG